MSQLLQFDVVLVSLDPTIGSEIKKTRPCVVVSPNAMNRHLRTVIIAPITSKGKPAKFRAATNFNDIPGQILLDQLRVIDRQRVVKSLGQIEHDAVRLIKRILGEMFA